MPTLGNNVFDSGLSYLQTNGTRLDITSAEATSYFEATDNSTGFSLGNKTALSIGAPADRGGGGREVVVPSISDGSVTKDGTASHYAITDATAELLATGALSATQAVTNGNVFTLTSFAVGIPDPA